MSDASFASIIRARLAHAGADARDDAVLKTAAYLALLAKWNARMNLTAFDLAHPSDAAIDRLIVEAVQAAAHVRAADRLMIDIGSGGGSPAFPFLIAAPHALRAVLIEARTRRSAFLREAVRVLELPDIEVDTSRFGPGWRTDLSGTVDLVTIRAVRPDDDLWVAILGATHAGSRVVWFTDAPDGRHIRSQGQFKISAETRTFVVMDRR